MYSSNMDGHRGYYGENNIILYVNHMNYTSITNYFKNRLSGFLSTVLMQHCDQALVNKLQLDFLII